MNSSVYEARADKVWFDVDNMWIALSDGRLLAVPKIWFPRLLNATDEELENHEFSGRGAGIHWDCLDEDISVPNLLLGYRDRTVQRGNKIKS